MPLKAEAKEFSGKQAVVVAVDFSPQSEAALVWACRYGRRMKVPVIAFHAVHEPNDQPGFHKRDKKNQLTPLKDVAAKMMDAFLKRVRKNNPKVPGISKVNSALAKELPVDRILTATDKLDASLLVLGSRYRKTLADRIIGSVVEQIVRQSPVPVTVVKIPEDGKDNKK